MKKERSFKNRNVSIRVTEGEWTLLHEKFRGTTFRHFVDYLRALLFHTPVVTTYRSQSLDEFQPVAGAIHEHLATIRRDFTRAVKTLRERPLDEEARDALAVLLATQSTVSQDIDTIKKTITKFYEDARLVQTLPRDGQAGRL